MSADRFFQTDLSVLYIIVEACNKCKNFIIKSCFVLQVACKYANNGCLLTLPRTLIEEHNHLCEFQNQPGDCFNIVIN